jgi:hypothetical protein
MDSRRQEWHGLELVLKLGAMSRRSDLLSILIILAPNHLLNPPNDTKQVAY